MYVCVYIYIRIRILDIPWSLWEVRVRRMKNALLIFLLVFWLKAKLDYWYMPPCICIYACMCVCLSVCVCVFEEIIQISGTAGECVYTWAWHTHPHTRTRVTQKFIALPHRTPPFRFSLPLVLAALPLPLFRYAPPPAPFTLSGYCSCHTSQVSFICNNFSFYTLYS